MAYTKSNELMTRIALKYDSYANWTSNNPVLLAGEIAIATIPVTDHETMPTHFQNLPNVVMKVGDGSSHYNDLKFVSALAADVYDWAKAAQKPTYKADEIVDLQKFVEDHSDFDTNTQYTVVPVAGAEYKYELKYKELTDTDFKSFASPVYMDMSGADARLKAIEDVIDSLTGVEGEAGGITEMINKAIAGLDAEIDQPAGADGLALHIKQVDGVITEMSGSIAANTYDAYGAAAAAEEAAKKHADDLMAQEVLDRDAAILVETNARKAAIEALDVAAVEGAQEGTVIKFIDKVAQNDGVVSAELGELHFNSAYNAETNKAATMKDVVDAVADLEGAMHFRGVVEGDSFEAAIAASGMTFAAGDIVLFKTVEYVYDGSKWVQLGDETMAGAMISALDLARVNVGAAKTLSFIEQEDGLVKAEAVDIEIAQSQVTGLEDRLDAIEAQFGDAEGSLADLVADNAAAIATINGNDAGKSMREVAVDEASKAVGALDLADEAVAGKYVAAVKQTDGQIEVVRADLPVIPDLELVEGTATTPEALEVAVVADIDVAGHKITDTRVNVATMAGVEARIAAGDGDRDVTSADAEGNFYVVNGLVQKDGAVTLKEKKLAKIAESGNIADLKQTADTYVVFNCGSSSVNI